MPWHEATPMEQREQFVRDQQRGLYTMTELCARYDVSRKTGYKWLDRFDEGGRGALQDRSRAPHRCPHAMSDEVAQLVCDARRAHPTWGPAKLLDWLAPRHPGLTLPAASTAGDLLAREGLVNKRRRRRSDRHPGVVPATTTQPNDLWTADFKGHFRTGDGIYCYPLTVADLHTRCLLGCQGLLTTTGAGVQAVFERLFRIYGLPDAIRTDNGVPFATVAIHGLSALNVWWIQLGIQHQRILPAHPQQNGAHERMHRTLKREAIRPARATLAAQQRAFNRFRAEYNDERPHQALGGRTPGELYRPSPRTYTGVVPPVEYPGHFIVKHVTNAGTFRFKKRLVFIANALIHHRVGLEEVADGIWSIYFCRVLIGRLDERDYTVHGTRWVWKS
jgi:transposase InsO family protein